MNYNFEKTSEYYIKILKFLCNYVENRYTVKQYETFKISCSQSTFCVRSEQEDRNIITLISEHPMDVEDLDPLDGAHYRLLQRNNHLYISSPHSSYLYNEIFSLPSTTEDVVIVDALTELNEELLFQYSTLYGEPLTESLRMDVLIRDFVPKDMYLNIDLVLNIPEIIEPIYREMCKIKRP